MFLSLGAWGLGVEWFLAIAAGLVLTGALLCLLGCISLARLASATEESEPRQLARVWFTLTSLWSAGLLVASLWPGRLEENRPSGFDVAAPVVTLAWTYTLAKLALNRRRPREGEDGFHPGRLGEVWGIATTLFCSVLAVLWARELLERPAGFLWVLLQTATWILALHFVSWFLLRELPARVAAPSAPLRMGSRVAIAVLRVVSATAAVLLCAASRDLDGAPLAMALIQTGLAFVGGVHLLLETLIRELPRGARTLWLASTAITLAVGAVTLVSLGVPRRTAFELYRAQFDACVARGEEGIQNVGPWQVDLRSDAEGGVFLETWSAREPYNSDARLHLGFAHRPNGRGTAFGDWTVELQPLGGDWYEFRATEPWD